MSTKIRDIIRDRALRQIAPGATLQQAAKQMAEQQTGALVVLEGELFVGILSERDIVFRGVAQDLRMAEAKVADVMTRDPVTVDIDDMISEAFAAKLGVAFRHLPVMEEGRVVGLLSYRDIPAEYLKLFQQFRSLSGGG